MLARYSQGPGIDQPLDVVTGGATKYYDADGLGSITSLADIGGSLTDTYTTDTFGKTTASSGTTRNPYRYTARDLDSETGLMYYRARYYDARSGHFLSEDPLRFNADHNFYRYVYNSPVDYVDPSGLEKLPKDPSGLDPNRWKPEDPNAPDAHRDPGSQRFKDPDGNALDFTPGKPGAPGWDGRDHWHWNPYDPNKGKCVKDRDIGDRGHLAPGDEIPDLPKRMQESQWRPFRGAFWDSVRDWQRQVENDVWNWLNRDPSQNWPLLYPRNDGKCGCSR